MMSEAAQQSEAERRKRTKEVYERLLRTVDHNSGNAMPPLASKPSTIGTLHRAGCGLDEIYRAMTAARANGDLFEATDADGRKRLGINDGQRLLEKIETYCKTRDDLRRDVIGLASKRRQQLRSD